MIFNKSSLNKIDKWIKQNKFSIFLMFLVLVTRGILLIDNMIPFGFDHGKDNLAIFHMWQLLSPKFIGPWTSIPGLYFGPAWYYLLLPGLILFNGNPVGAAWIMVFLVMIQVYLVVKHFGQIAGLMVVTTSTWLTISQSAWNPFPMTLVSFCILIILKKVKQSNKLSLKQVFLLAFWSSLGFHFSTAFAIFFPLIILITLLFEKLKLTKKMIPPLFIGFTIPFIPQIIFEFFHNFVETKAVIKYFIEGEQHSFNFEKVVKVIKVFIGELRLAISSNIWLRSELLENKFNNIVYALVILVILFSFFRKDKKDQYFGFKDLIIWTIIPLIGFFFLHFNFWYLLGIFPIWLIITAQAFEKSNKLISGFYIVLLIISLISRIWLYYEKDRSHLAKSRAFFPVKLEAIELIRDKAGDRAFASYHYVPDIYDFSYQYIYFWQAQLGKRLPVEFSYKPDEVIYVQQKQELLNRYKYMQDKREVEIKYYIVEEPLVDDFLDNWWYEQDYEEILNEYKIGNEVTVYEAI